MEPSMLVGLMFFPTICLIGMKILNDDDDNIIAFQAITLLGMIIYGGIVAANL